MEEFIQEIFGTIDSTGLNALLLMGIAIFGGTIGGRLFQKIRIPQVVGYIVIGVAVGGLGTGLLTPGVLESFEPLNTFALGIIGFLIGGELKGKTIKRYGAQFTWILLFEALTAFIFASLTVYLAFMILGTSPTTALVSSLLMGSIAAATAAAGTTDVLWESKSRGPLTTTILGIIALDDILALLLFALMASLGEILLTGGAQPGRELLVLAWELGGAIALGSLTGWLLAWLLRNSSDRERILTFSLGSILLVLGLSTLLGLDTIMSAMVMGVMITNIAPKKSREVFHVIESLAPPVYVLFFVFVGASMNVGAMDASLSILALAYLAGRSGGKMLGAWLGALAGRSVPGVRKNLPFALFSQSGVAIGLSILASQRFAGEIGNTIILTVTATTFVVQIIGPIILRWAIKRSGEAGLNLSDEDIIRQSSIPEVLDSNTPLLEEGLPISTALEKISRSESLYFPVVDRQGKLKGVLSIEGIKNAFIARDLTDMILVMDLMEPLKNSVDAHLPLSDARDLMLQKREEYLPVVDGAGAPLGILEQRSIERHVSRKLLEFQAHIRALDGGEA